MRNPTGKRHGQLNYKGTVKIELLSLSQEAKNGLIIVPCLAQNHRNIIRQNEESVIKLHIEVF